MTAESRRLWLAFANSGAAPEADPLRTVDAWLSWLAAHGALDAERVAGLMRRAYEQPAGAGAALVEARRMRAAVRALAVQGAGNARPRADAVAEVNRVLGRSPVARRVEPTGDGGFRVATATAGDVFAGLLLPVVESAAASLVAGELARVRACGGCGAVFYDATRNGNRRWCAMGRCGNRAKQRRWRARAAGAPAAAPPRITPPTAP